MNIHVTGLGECVLVEVGSENGISYYLLEVIECQ